MPKTMSFPDGSELEFPDNISNEKMRDVSAKFWNARKPQTTQNVSQQGGEPPKPDVLSQALTNETTNQVTHGMSGMVEEARQRVDEYRKNNTPLGEVLKNEVKTVGKQFLQKGTDILGDAAMFVAPEVKLAGPLAKAGAAVGVGKAAALAEKVGAFSALNGGISYLKSVVGGGTQEEAISKAKESATVSGVLDLATRGLFSLGASTKEKLASLSIPSNIAKFSRKALDYIDENLSKIKDLSETEVSQIKQNIEVQKSKLDQTANTVGENISGLKQQVESENNNFQQMKSLTADELNKVKEKNSTEGASRFLGDTKYQTKVAKNELSNFFSKTDAVQSSGLSDSTVKLANSHGVDPEKIKSTLDSIENDIQSKTVELSNHLNKVSPAIKKQFSSEYTTLLKGDTGQVPVDIGDELKNVNDTLDILSSKRSSSQTKITSLMGQLSQFVKEKQGKEALASLPGRMSVSDFKALGLNIGPKMEITASPSGIKLKDAHYIKQALNEWGDSLMKSPSNQQMGVSLKKIGDSIAEKIDAQVGGQYSDISGRYRKYKETEELGQSFLGKTYLKNNSSNPEEIFSERGKRVSSEMGKMLKDGQISPEDYYNSTNGIVRSMTEQSSVLRQNGLNKLADDIDRTMTNLKQNFMNKAGIDNIKNDLNFALENNLSKAERNTELLKRQSEDTINAASQDAQKKLSFGEQQRAEKEISLKNSISNEKSNLASQQKQYNEFKVNSEQQVSQIKQQQKSKQKELDQYETIIKKNLKENKIDFHKLLSERYMAKDIAGAIPGPIGSKLKTVLTAASSLRMLGATGSNAALNGILNLENKLSAIGLPHGIRQASILFLNKIRDDIKEEK